MNVKAVNLRSELDKRGTRIVTVSILVDDKEKEIIRTVCSGGDSSIDHTQYLDCNMYKFTIGKAKDHSTRTPK